MRNTVILLAVMAIGCIHGQSPEEIAAYHAKARAAWDKASKIRVTINPEQVRGCQSLGTITMPWSAGISVMKDPDGRSEGLSDSDRYLRLETVTLGGDAALSSTQTAPQERRRFYLNRFDTEGYTVSGEAAHVVGEAYLCGTLTPAPTPTRP